jgi:hypothetical protein
MAFKVTISDGTILRKSIESISFNVDPPKDNFDDMRDFTINSMQVTGKIGAGENTNGLYEWSLIPENNDNCYKEITVEQTHAGQVIRKVKFPKAFVVDYSESFTKYESVGHFSILVRQLAYTDIDIDATSQSPQDTEIDTKSETIIEKEIVPVIAQEASTKITTKKPESRMSFTDRLTKQKETQNKVDISSSDPEELKKIFAEEIEQSKKAFERATDMIKKKKLKGCVASNGKITLSGFDGKTTKLPEEFTRVPLDTMFDYCNKIGHELPAKVPDFYDNGIKGSFFACHAEKQLSLLTDKPIGISKPMCSNCVEYFSKHAVHTKQVKITTDPKTTRIFFPNGVIREV